MYNDTLVQHMNGFKAEFTNLLYYNPYRVVGIETLCDRIIEYIKQYEAPDKPIKWLVKEMTQIKANANEYYKNGDKADPDFWYKQVVGRGEGVIGLFIDGLN